MVAATGCAAVMIGRGALGRAVDLPRRAGSIATERARDHPPSRRAHRGAPARAAGAGAAQEAPGVVLGRAARLGRAAPAAVRGDDAGGGPRAVLGAGGRRDASAGSRTSRSATASGAPSKTLTDAHFMFFAGMTGDAHPIHYDDEYAKKTRFGRRLAHGLLLTSLTAVGASTLAPHHRALDRGLRRADARASARRSSSATRSSRTTRWSRSSASARPACSPCASR